MRRKTRDT